MIRLRHRDIIGAVCAAWVATMGVCIHLAGCWFGVEQLLASGVHRGASNGSGGGRLVPALPGAPTALSLPRTSGLHTGESAASARRSGFACCQSGVEGYVEELSRDVASNGRARPRNVAPTSVVIGSTQGESRAVKAYVAEGLTLGRDRGLAPCHPKATSQTGSAEPRWTLREECGAGLWDGSAQGVRLVPPPSSSDRSLLGAAEGLALTNVGTQSVKSRCCMFGLGFDSRRLHGGAMVSTGSKRTMETAGKDSRKTDQNQKRQLPVEAGGLTAPEDAGSPRHQNQPYRSMASNAAALCGVPVPLYRSLIGRESSWRHYDSRGRVLRSSAGALGLAQVMPGTALDLVHPSTDIREPWGNLLAGACILRRYYERAGSWRGALHSYHAGPSRRVTSARTLEYAADIIGGAE